MIELFCTQLRWHQIHTVNSLEFYEYFTIYTKTTKSARERESVRKTDIQTEWRTLTFGLFWFHSIRTDKICLFFFLQFNVQKRWRMAFKWMCDKSLHPSLSEKWINFIFNAIDNEMEPQWMQHKFNHNQNDTHVKIVNWFCIGRKMEMQLCRVKIAYDFIL